MNFPVPISRVYNVHECGIRGGGGWNDRTYTYAFSARILKPQAVLWPLWKGFACFYDTFCNIGFRELKKFNKNYFFT